MNDLIFVYAGTYTQDIMFGTGQIFHGMGKGIYCYRVNMETGRLELSGITDGVPNPSYMTLDKTGSRLYAVNELKSFDGADCGSVSAFSVDRPGGGLSLINVKPTGGTDPCHVSIDDGGNHIFVSNYMSGSLCVIPINKDGSMGDASQFIQDRGSGVNPLRQEGPHLHSVVLDKSNCHAFAADLGIDKLLIYKYNSRAETPLEPEETPWVRTDPGSGPRTAIFSPDGSYCYLISEFSSTIDVFCFKDENASLEKIQTVKTIPVNFTSGSSAADLQFTPDGRFLYASNRGHDSIAIYSCDTQSGMLTIAGCEKSGGKTPRSIAVDPTGSLLFSANQDSDNITVFSINKKTGELMKISQTALPAPVCIKPVMFVQ